MSQKFQRRIENFTCRNCRNEVIGNGFTDHCPKCLYSLHVDIFPGDRANECQGLLEPIDIAPDRSSYKIFYSCKKCGQSHTNKSAEDDDITSFLTALKNR